MIVHGSSLFKSKKGITMNRTNKVAYSAVIVGLVLEVAGFFKMSSFFGMPSSFSGFTVLGPVAGAFIGLGLYAGILAVHRLVRFALFGTVLPVTCYVPSLAGSLYWSHNTRLVRIGLPALCMLAFLIHPVGSQAFLYSFYWFIPIALYFIPRQSVFFTALGATFTQHAVGSVMWLYAGSLTAAEWYALIPVVAVERLCAAIALTLAFYSIKALIELVRQSAYSLKTA